MAAAAGAGLFFGFRELWSWNQGIALVLGVLFIAILVASLWVIRKTVDLISILIAIVVGALIAFGPLVLMLQAVD
ncbi:transmembrane protein [Mycobacteroides abscessus subsp. abscessus]|nr:transmembrane protein [Mycobacteroides abscessus subsp. abscessus]SHS61434.1 transmembrane protein [Mycobacteroides abscessus subsp. abscessus]SHU43998.1 transmembrane protein [Mycobacteroides abscessus subsp. abscessus]SHX04497.1 transmembrane protein [Mycobacteroides abscessus subsp. abscessus]SHX44919.1 transmembrane protein [Mycobacteroides abscessus subsp. abscessus]